MAKRKRNNTLIIALVAIIAVLVAVAIWKSNTRSDAEKVSVENVQRRTLTEKVAASGKVFPRTEVKISSDVSGEIVELPVEEGDSVVAGQLLAKIDPDAYLSQVERTTAGVNSAKAQLANSRSQVKQFEAQKEQIQSQLKNARDIHQRNEKLFEQGVISDLDYESSLANVQQLEANLRSAEANIEAAKESVRAAEYQVRSAQATLEETKTSLRRTTIYAPISGIISSLSVEEGERVVGTIQMTGTEMMRIANLNEMEVQVEVSENDIPRVSVGDEVDIEVDAYLDRIFKGQVSQIANSALNTTGTAVSLTTDQVTNFVVTIDLDPKSYDDLVSPQKPYPFRPGMSASVEIYTQTVENALSVPIQAVTTREEEEDEENPQEGVESDEIKEVVFLIPEGADTVRLVEVKTGIQDDTYIHITAGLEEGDEVVVGPYTAVARELEEGSVIERTEEEELYSSND